MNASRSWTKAGRLLGLSALAASLFTSCKGLGIASPEAEVTLRVEGYVRDALTEAPIPNAKVRVARWATPYGYTELDAVRTDAAGHYSLTYRLSHVATEKEFEGSCTVWHQDTTTDVELQAEAAGYLTWELDGFDAVPALRCTDELQHIELRMRR